MTTGKRLYQYALQYKRIIILALFMLTLAVAAELAGPFVAKRIIDHHILGIQSHWYEVPAGEEAVKYEAGWYMRDDYLPEGTARGKALTIIQNGIRFLLVEEAIPLDAEYEIGDGYLTATGGETYRFTVLANDQVYGFYQPEIPRITKLIGFYLALLIVAAIFHYGQSFLLQKAANRIIKKMRDDLFRHLSTLPIRYFDHFAAGKIVSRITNDTETVKGLYMTVLSNFFSSSIYLFGIYIALFILDWKLALFALMLLPVLGVWAYIYRKYASRYNQVMQSKNSDINGVINESIEGLAIIQAFRRESMIKEEFGQLNEDYFRTQRKMIRLNAMTSFNLVSMLKNIAFVSFIVYFGNISFNGAGVVSIGVLYAFVDYINRLFEPVQGIVNQFSALEEALVGGARVFTLLDEKGEEVSFEKMPRYRGNVTFDRVSFGYDANKYVLKDISFSAQQGETIAFVGHTGSGKSSIMNLLFRYYEPGEGEIKIDGINIRHMPKQAMREHMGIVLQEPYLFTGTIASNVSLGSPAISDEEVQQALKEVGVSDFIERLDQGIHTPVMERGSTFSSGQRQLISFARALAFKPAILILDEATSHVDSETEHIIQEALEVLKRGRTTFIIAHRLSTIRNADLIIVLDQGRITESGTHEQLMREEGKYYTMYKAQAGQVVV
ncbi:MAG: ABC transporter ATP-binding protein [Bacillus sp. (in: firmicutes)]